jgi:hypothetical protein
MDKEKETVWTSDMGFMPPIPKTEGRTICREECQLTEYKQEIERLREVAKDRPKDRPNEASDEIERLHKTLQMWVKFWEADGDDVWLAEEAMESTRNILEK